MERSHKTTNNRPNADARRFARETKKSIKEGICKKIDVAKLENNGRTPHKFLQDLLEGHKEVCPWLTRNVVNRAYKTHMERMRDQIVRLHTAFQPPPPLPAAESRSRGGRPQGTTRDDKQNYEVATVAVTNEIATAFMVEKQEAKQEGKRLKSGRLKEIIQDRKNARGLQDIIIPYSTIRTRVRFNKVICDGKRGLQSPMLSVEPTLLRLVLQMSCIRQCLSPSDGLSLANSMIKGTEIEKEVFAWKEKFCAPAPELGRGYWAGFKKRDEHLLVSVRGQKYALDRNNWTTYANFALMYLHIGEEMEEAQVAVKLDDPVWMDKDGNIVEEGQAFGQKVTHRITRPDMFLVGDEVGGNTSQLGDGNIGGKLMLCERGTVPQRKVSNKDKHFTLMGLTALTGKPVMCILVLTGKTPKTDVETGIDMFAESIGVATDHDFFINNSGPGKRFPGGPTCNFRGKEIPCFVRWSDKGSMTSEILRDSLATLDTYKLFDTNREEGVKPFVLLDGHGSRIEMPFLEYINDPAHEWVVCIGVPYGTALWQVGNSREQNGSYKIALAKGKKELMEKKEAHLLRPTVEPYEIMILVNYAWERSFARVDKNKNAICDRGWFPYNRALLMLSEIRATMTKDERLQEIEYDILPNRQDKISELTDESRPTFDQQFLFAPATDSAKALNYSSGSSARVLDSLISHGDMMTARERIKKSQDDGRLFAEKLAEARQVTAGQIFKAGSSRLGKTVFDIKQESINREIARVKAQHEGNIQKYAATKKKADNFLALKKPYSLWTISDFKVVLAPLKTRADGKMPLKKQELQEAYLKWKDRPPKTFDGEIILHSGDSDGDSDDDDLDAMQDFGFEGPTANI